MVQQKIKNFINHNKLFLTAIMLFLGIFFLLGLIHQSWGFDIDDGGCLYGSKIQSWYDIFSMFAGKDHYSLIWPSNYNGHSQIFLNVFYRPLCRLLFVPQYIFFGSNPYGYFLIMIGIHAINSILLFYIFYQVTKGYYTALWMALLFAFHMSTASWMGWIAAQNYPVALMFLIISLLCFVNFLKNNRASKLYLSVVIFFATLFIFELVIFFPFVLLGLWFMQDFLIENVGINKTTCAGYVCKIIPFFVALGVFLAVRLYNYPFALASSNGVSNSVLIKQFLQTRILHSYADIASLLADFCGVASIGSGNFLFKFGLISAFLGILSMLWIGCRYKKETIFFLASMMLALWPAYIKFYVGRYAYFALPFFVLFLGFLISYSNYSFMRKRGLKNIVYGCMVLFLLGNMLHTIVAMQKREYFSTKIYNAYSSLLSLPGIKNKNLCFIAIPNSFRTGLAQSVWMFGINEGFPIYYDYRTFVEHNFVPCEQGVVISPISQGFCLAIEDEKNSWFNGLGDACSMGQLEVIKRHTVNNNPIKIEYKFDKKYFDQNLVFVTWDFFNLCFKLL